MQIQNNSVTLKLCSGVTLFDCSRYTHWLTRTITWLFGRSVDVQFDEDIQRVSIGDIAAKLFDGIGSDSSHRKSDALSIIERDLKTLTYSCRTPLTNTILDEYAKSLKNSLKEPATETWQKPDTDSVVQNVIYRVCNENFQKTLLLIDEHTATLNGVLEYCTHRPEDKELIDSIRPLADRIHQTALYGENQKLFMQNCRLLNILGIQPGASLVAEETQTPMATDISSEKDIASCRRINGISIEEIERRARPRAFAFSGFLGKDESLKEVMLKDWKNVKKMGLTHIQLADKLSEIVQKADQGSREEREIVVKMVLTKGALQKPKAQTLKAWHGRTRGFQECLFDKGRWSVHSEITHVKTGQKVIWNPGVEGYIRNYGFYEGGGKENKYRVDPIRFVSMLTGRTEAELIKTFDLVTDP